MQPSEDSTRPLINDVWENKNERGEASNELFHCPATQNIASYIFYKDELNVYFFKFIKIYYKYICIIRYFYFIIVFYKQRWNIYIFVSISNFCISFPKRTRLSVWLCKCFLVFSSSRRSVSNQPFRYHPFVFRIPRWKYAKVPRRSVLKVWRHLLGLGSGQKFDLALQLKFWLMAELLRLAEKTNKVWRTPAVGFRSWSFILLLFRNENDPIGSGAVPEVGLTDRRNNDMDKSESNPMRTVRTFG